MPTRIATPCGECFVERFLDKLRPRVREGDLVEAGDTIIVLEAMKMEQPLTAHKAGTVSGLNTAIGETVPAGTVLATITASPPLSPGQRVRP